VRSAGNDNHRLPFALDRDGQSAGLRQQAGVKKLDRMRIDRLILLASGYEHGHRLRHPSIEPTGFDAESPSQTAD
jgi:hypothetical protein